jgi:hypothetical protein
MVQVCLPARWYHCLYSLAMLCRLFVAWCSNKANNLSHWPSIKGLPIIYISEELRKTMNNCCQHRRSPVPFSNPETLEYEGWAFSTRPRRSIVCPLNAPMKLGGQCLWYIVRKWTNGVVYFHLQKLRWEGLNALREMWSDIPPKTRHMHVSCPILKYIAFVDLILRCVILYNGVCLLWIAPLKMA